MNSEQCYCGKAPGCHAGRYLHGDIGVCVCGVCVFACVRACLRARACVCGVPVAYTLRANIPATILDSPIPAPNSRTTVF